MLLCFGRCHLIFLVCGRVVNSGGFPNFSGPDPQYNRDVHNLFLNCIWHLEIILQVLTPGLGNSCYRLTKKRVDHRINHHFNPLYKWILFSFLSINVDESLFYFHNWFPFALKWKPPAWRPEDLMYFCVHRVRGAPPENRSVAASVSE